MVLTQMKTYEAYSPGPNLQNIWRRQ